MAPFRALRRVLRGAQDFPVKRQGGGAHLRLVEVRLHVRARLGGQPLAAGETRYTDSRGLLELLQAIAADVAQRFGVSVDPARVLAVSQVESGGYYLAVSHVGAIGLMQLIPATAEELAGKLELDWRGPDSLFDPVINVKLGTAYIKHLADRYGDVSTALAAYNWGPTRIDRRIRIGSGVPSRYSKLVMKAFKPISSKRTTPPPARG
ncbi:MAG: transglycosylase SLT domain-containing protein [Proteobacteria bacterium]|nr:transglycosylase SLT domain-containing protein [Pseudomonadota bacterium]